MPTRDHSRRAAGTIPPPARIATFLRAEADAHTPDRERIRARAFGDLNPSPAAVHAASDSWRRRPLVRVLRHASAHPFAIAAATVLIAVGSIQRLRFLAASRSRLRGTAGTDDGSHGRAVSAIPSARMSVVLPAAATGEAAVVVTITATRLAVGKPLLLGSAGERDWVVFGARPDGAPVRAERPLARIGDLEVLPADGGQQALLAAVAPAPFDVSWIGGAPTNRGDNLSTWLAVDAEAGRFRVVVPAGTPAGELQVDTGVVGATGWVVARTGNTIAQLSLADTGLVGDAVPFAVRVVFGPLPLNEPLVVDLSATGTSPAPQLAIVAVALY